MQQYPPLSHVETALRELLLPEPPSRPFLCDGSPLECDVVLVGINPATVTPFWPFWSAEVGFNKAGWLKAYYADSKNQRNQTRPRIELLRQELSPYKCIELNIYPYSSPSEPELPAHLRDTKVFDFMLGLVRPKLLFVFGNTPIKELECLMGVQSFAKQRFCELAAVMKMHLANNTG